MQHYRCKCGESSFHGSGEIPKNCQGCAKCGTTYAQHPGEHKPISDHKLKLQFDRNTGEHSHYVCENCFARVGL